MYQVYASAVVNGNVLAPPEDELWYAFNESGQPTAGGFCILGPINATSKTALTRINASEAKHAELQTDPQYDYLQVEKL